MAAVLTDVMEEVEPAHTDAQRHVELELAGLLEAGPVLIRLHNGIEFPLTYEDVQGLRALATARSQGQRVWVIGHDTRMSPQQAAVVLDVSRPLIYRFIEQGKLPAERVGSHYRLRASDVLALKQYRAEQAEAIDAGITHALQTGARHAHSDVGEEDAMSSWRNATDEQREATLARIRNRHQRQPRQS